MTKNGAAADLTLSEAGVAVKYNAYLRNDILLQFQSTDRSRVELAARLLRLAGVDAEVKKAEVGGKDMWYVEVSTDKLAAGREELRKALAEIVKRARDNGWIDASKAERWLEKLEEGRVLKEGWPKYLVRLSSSGALEVKFSSTNRNSIEQVAQRLRDMGLEEGRHFTVKKPEEGRFGYVSILKEGLAHAAWLSVRGEGEQQRRLATDFVEYILQRAKEACRGAEQCAVYEKVKEIIEEGRAWRSLTLRGFEKEVEVNGVKYKVKVIGGGAEIEESRHGKKLLRIKITAEVDGVRREYTITYGRRGKLNKAMGRAYASAEADAERFSALVKALTGEEPKVYRKSDGTIELVCGRAHLEGFKRFAELADTIEKWLEETGQ